MEHTLDTITDDAPSDEGGTGLPLVVGAVTGAAARFLPEQVHEYTQLIGGLSGILGIAGVCTHHESSDVRQLIGFSLGYMTSHGDKIAIGCYQLYQCFSH
ncbi:MAG: hypothetical protein OXR66_02735 [Candidatus Woesearchaeota archaeon]|nr:hypothetical protein [Candidatus Woesearchaeota archaeon]